QHQGAHLVVVAQFHGGAAHGVVGAVCAHVDLKVLRVGVLDFELVTESGYLVAVDAVAPGEHVVEGVAPALGERPRRSALIPCAAQLASEPHRLAGRRGQLATGRNGGNDLVQIGPVDGQCADVDGEPAHVVQIDR